MRALVKLLTIIWGGGLLLQLLLSVSLVNALTIDRAMLAGSILNYALSWRIGPLDDIAVQTEAAKYWTKAGERHLGTDAVSSIWIVDSRGAVELLWLESPL
jgi:hypothetical protein